MLFDLNSMTATARCTKLMPACLLASGLDGAGEALRILVNEASRMERAQHLQATPYERSAQRVDTPTATRTRPS